MAAPKKKKKKSNALFYVIFVLGVLICIGVLIYPAVSNYLYGNVKSYALIKEYEEKVEIADTGEKEAALEEARKYNELIARGLKTTEEYDYASMLNLTGTGMMATIEIPRINVALPIYHGDTSDSLEKGAAHLTDSSLPVGGINTHAVISAHTGLAGKALFSDLEKMELGDVFYIKVLGETLAYQVDNIEVVEPWEKDKLHIIEGKDCVTLVTCTPYGVNTHRLLVRGSRIPYEEAVVVEQKRQEEAPVTDSNWTDEYTGSLKLGAIVAGGILLLFLVIIPGIKKLFGIGKKKKKEEEEPEAEEQGPKEEGDPDEKQEG